MRPASQVVRTKLPTNMAIDNAICHTGTPNGSRAIMIMGEENGIMDSQMAIGASGFSTTDDMNAIEKMMGRDMGSINCPISAWLSTADDTAAKKEL